MKDERRLWDVGLVSQRASSFRQGAAETITNVSVDSDELKVAVARFRAWPVRAVLVKLM